MPPKVYHVEGVRHIDRNRVPHAAEFEQFRRCLCLAQERTHLLTWQELLARAEATFDPGVRPLLAHAGQLSYLQPI